MKNTIRNKHHNVTETKTGKTIKNSTNTEELSTVAAMCGVILDQSVFIMILFRLWSVFAINTRDCTFICLLPILYWSEVGRFRVGVGLGGPMKVYIYIQLFIFFTDACKSN